ncbi:RNA polymerase sigma factor SigZ [Petroclostridium sp. X23]|uniref:RNA polymerase sigma factor SigZ n=1 Tax=Petroclostridium sp. X23 TaxID=3045146 RepID=UPI0024AD0BD9|nr:RNA polymerase sigma factor SigZ [Petroclostridium sp. X23]WHH61739.1 RNA polymerase sigma factor SigZ [Petroclostridium sp. X23]
MWEDLSANLKKYISKRVSNSYDAEDILQEVFLKINAHITEIKDTAQIYAWIYQITRNTIIDYYRNKKQAEQLPDIPDENTDANQIELSSELITCLKPMIDRLPEKYKQAILLTELGELTQKELAVKLGLSISGAKSRVQRGRAMLKEMFLECCLIQCDVYGHIIDYKHRENDCKYC